jgi:hypothetical protein
MKKTYTIGEIFRLGLLKNHKGEPYSSKATVSKELRGLPYTIGQTPHGLSKRYSEESIKKQNSRWG